MKSENENIRFFDCNCVIGRRLEIIPGSYHDTQELVRKMNYYGIESAMAYHAMARYYSPIEGNRALLDEIKDNPFLKGVWVVMPHHTGEFPEPMVLREEMKKSGVKAVRMFPSSEDHMYSIADWSCGELFSMLEKCRIPLMLDARQLSFNELHDVMAAHPRLRIILTEIPYTAGRNLYPLFKKFEQFHIETNGYKIFGGIEEFCKLFGADRMVFGSGMPVYSGSSAAMVNYAEISPAEKRMIASENLERLLGGVML